MVRLLRRAKLPSTWHVGRKSILNNMVWELLEIDDTLYLWIATRPRIPGETVDSINRRVVTTCSNT